ncbi:MAG: DEAD/DEAH box helicase [Desulfobacterales bacterium]|nr:DEAD/DEAH box helicase [Desulfobacterales bacterium]
MQGLVFIYEEKRSVKNRMFTVRLEERKKNGNTWVPAGPERVYTARDLQGPGLRIIDKELFSMAFKSETDLRQLEGRFFSADQEYTLFRISPYDLRTFFNRCARTNLLCGKEGGPVRFKYKGTTIPEVVFTDTGNGVVPGVFLNGRQLDGSSYEMVSNPVRVMSGNTVYELPRDLPVKIIRGLIKGGKKSYDEYEALLKTLSQYAGKLDLRLPGKKKKTIRRLTGTPVFDIDRSFRSADLGFMYEGFGLFAMGDKRTVVFNHEKNLELHRNLVEEDGFQDQLKTCGVMYRPANRRKWFIPEGKKEEILYRLHKKGFCLRLAGKPLRIDIRVAWDIRVTKGEISVGGAVRYGKDRAGLDNILDAFLEGQHWFDLPGGSAGYIPALLAGDLTRLEHRGDFGDDDIRFAPHDFSFVAEVFNGKSDVSRDRAFDGYLSFLRETARGRHRIESPASLTAELRPYQKTGFNWLAGLQQFGFSGILADDMGLGKTIQVLALVLYLKERDPASFLTLVIVPKTLIWNWESEIKKFAPSLNIKIHAGPGRDKALPAVSDADMVITSYGIVRQDITLLKQVSWDLVVLDEAQAVKNPDAEISRSVKSLKSSTRLALTGTPIENRPLDLWSLFDFLMPGFLGDKAAFKRRYEKQDSLDTLGILTAPFILRRMKKEVCKELPLKTEITIHCSFTDAQKACYDDILMKGRHQLSGGDASGGNRSVQILTILLRLRQAACHPSLVPGAAPGPSGKLDAVLETALDILGGGHKILIFSQFVAHLELVREMFEARGVEHYTLYGSTGKRKAMIRRFKASPNPSVFLISLKTGGVGLNLTEAGYVFLLDPWWNPAAENQAIDRSHRIGQENPVTVYRFITRGSVEENVNRLKQKKRQIEKAVLQHGGDIRIPEKELLELIR